jgi:hypothetical protein
MLRACIHRTHGPLPHYINIRIEYKTEERIKDSNITFYGNPLSGSTVVTCGRTDADDANRHFLQNFVVFPKNARRDFNLMRHVLLFCS